MQIERLVDRLLIRIIVILAVAILISQFFLSRNRTEVFPNDHPGMLAEPAVVVRKLTCGVRTVTAYSSTVDQTDASPFVTANGTMVKDGIVATNEFAFNTRLLINGKWYTVTDRTNSRYQKRVDIWMESREQALTWGKRDIQVCW